MHRRALPILAALLSFFILSAPAFAQADLATIEFGKAAPDFSLKDVNGKNVSLKNYRGKTVVLAFWASGCDKCLEQLRIINKFAASKKYKNVEFVFVTKPDKPGEKEKARTELDAEKFKYTLVYAPDNNLAWQYSVTVIPAFYVIDKKGNLQSAGISFPEVKLSTMNFLDVLDTVVRGKSVNACEFQPQKQGNPYVKFEGKPAPDVEATDAKGKKMASYFYRNFSRVLLVYWLPTCPHCKRELPHIETFYRKFKDKYNIEVIGIVGSADPNMKKLAAEYVEAKKITFPIAFDDGKASKPFEIKAFPTLILIDRKGTVAKTYEGEFAFAENVLPCAMEKMRD